MAKFQLNPGETLIGSGMKELEEGHFLYHKKVWAVAKCESNDDVLYVTDGERGTDTYYIFHLTYSKQNLEGFPKYKKFADIYAVKEFIEQAFIKNNIK